MRTENRMAKGLPLQRAGIVYSYLDKTEAFVDSIERDCRPNQHNDEDPDHMEEVEISFRRIRGKTRQENQEDQIVQSATL